MTKKATRKGAGSVTPQSGDTKPAKTGELNAKQLRFVDEYLIDLNGKQAAIRAGYSAKTAEVQASRLLSLAKVSMAVEVKRKELAHDLGITRERVLKEIAAIAFADVRKLYRADGSMLKPHEWPDDVAASVAGLDTNELRADGAAIGFTQKVKGWDKSKALENLLKHLGDGEKPDPASLVLLALPDVATFKAKLAAVLAK